MSWLSDLFSQKKVTQTPDKESWQLSAGKNLAEWAQKYLSTYKPGSEYGGSFTAGMAPGEASGQEWLAKYLNEPATGENYDLAANEIKKTLTGAYDPTTSLFYNAMKTGANTNLQDQIDAAKRSQGTRGSFFQSTGLTEERKLRENTTNYLDQILGKMTEQERQNRLNVVPQAMQLEQYKQGAPLAKASAGATLGALPRLIEQGDLEARYNDFLRKQQELQGTVSASQGVFGTGINYGVKDYTAPSAFERIMGTVAPLAGTILGNMVMPGVGGVIGGAAGSGLSSSFSNIMSGVDTSRFGQGALNFGK